MRELSIALTAATALVAGVSLFGRNTQAAVVAVGMERDTAGTGIKSDTSGTGITALSVGSSAVSHG